MTLLGMTGRWPILCNDAQVGSVAVKDADARRARRGFTDTGQGVHAPHRFLEERANPLLAVIPEAGKVNGNCEQAARIEARIYGVEELKASNQQPGAVQ